MAKKENTKKPVKQTVVDIDEVDFLIDPNLLDLEGKNKYMNCITILSDKLNLRKLKDLIDRLNLSPENNEYLTEINETSDKSILSEIIEYFRTKKDILKYSLMLDILNHNYIEDSQFMNYDLIHSFADQISCDKTAFNSILRMPKFLSRTEMDLDTKTRSCIFCYIDKPTLGSVFDIILCKVLPNIVSFRKEIIHTLDFELSGFVIKEMLVETLGYIPAKDPVNNLQYSLFLLYLATMHSSKLSKKEEIMYFENNPLIDFSISSIKYVSEYLLDIQDKHSAVVGIYPNSIKLYSEFVSEVLQEDVREFKFNLYKPYSSSIKRGLPNELRNYFNYNEDNVKLFKEITFGEDKFWKIIGSVLTVNKKPQKDLTFRLMKKAGPAEVKKSNKKNKK